ncbi:MAG: hypothetical protein JXR10_06810 [Cyclobacteriaceae bacterium]
MMKSYQYVGPGEILDRIDRESLGQDILSAKALINWLKMMKYAQGFVTLTYIVDQDGSLRIAPRESEHVACAGGNSVLAAGELIVDFIGNELSIAEITNLSTGYCPSPSCWPAVKLALEKTDIQFPDYFTNSYIFGICDNCGNRQVIKDDVYGCYNCGETLTSRA